MFSYDRRRFRRRRVRVGVKNKNPAEITQRGLCSGDVLLSHDLSSHYHRGCSVSLPCSEWERVVPLRYCHQSPMPDWRFAARQADAELWWRDSQSVKRREFLLPITSHLSLFTWERTGCFSEIYIQVFRILPPVTAAVTTSSEFSLRSFDLLCMPSSACAGDGLTEK
jgi:hypothetical protein